METAPQKSKSYASRTYTISRNSAEMVEINLDAWIIVRRVDEGIWLPLLGCSRSEYTFNPSDIVYTDKPRVVLSAEMRMYAEFTDYKVLPNTLEHRVTEQAAQIERLAAALAEQTSRLNTILPIVATQSTQIATASQTIIDMSESISILEKKNKVLERNYLYQCGTNAEWRIDDDDEYYVHVDSWKNGYFPARDDIYNTDIMPELSKAYKSYEHWGVVYGNASDFETVPNISNMIIRRHNIAIVQLYMTSLDDIEDKYPHLKKITLREDVHIDNKYIDLWKTKYEVVRQP